MELVEKKLLTLEKEKLEINDATQRIEEISTQLKTLIATAINTANETNSVDEKINSLVGGLQSIMNGITDYQLRHNTLLSSLNDKILVLEEILEEYIEAPVDELSQE